MTQPETSVQQPKKALFPPWPVTIGVFMVFAAYILASIVGESLIVVYGLLQGRQLDDIESWYLGSTFVQFISGVIIYGLMALATYLFVRSYKVSLKGLGLVTPRLRDIGIALLGIVPYIVGYGILLTVATTLFPSIDVEQEQQLGFEQTTNILALSLIFVSLVILPPIVEELTMRGLLLTSLLKRFKFLFAAIITSVIFAVAHLQFGSGAPLLWVAAIDTFILSLVLCYMRYKTGSLWPGIFLHALKNGVAFLSIFVFHLV
jgi:membrane protease YdiL (CAAX protease family)